MRCQKKLIGFFGSKTRRIKTLQRIADSTKRQIAVTQSGGHDHLIRESSEEGT
jgi:hypothetical protein